MSHRCLVVSAVSLVVASLATGAQAADRDTVDLQSRTGVDWNLNLPKRWTAEIEYQYRRVDDLATYRGSYFTLEAGHGLTKGINALAIYRLALTNDGDFNRFALGAEYDKRFERLRLRFRPLIQYRTEIVDDDETGGEGSLFLRTRLRLDFAVTQSLDVYASAEPFFAFGAGYPIDNWRNIVGLKYEYARNMGVDLYYIHRPDYGRSYNRLFHVIGLTFHFKTKVK
jgi:hypothetical protein